MNPDNLTWAEFERVDLRVGTILEARAFPEARRPAYQLLIDFGLEIGLKKSSAQITQHYTPETLVGRQVLAVVNFPPKQIANMLSECLLLGSVDGEDVTLLTTERPVQNGLRIG